MSTSSLAHNESDWYADRLSSFGDTHAVWAASVVPLVLSLALMHRSRRQDQSEQTHEFKRTATTPSLALVRSVVAVAVFIFNVIDVLLVLGEATVQKLARLPKMFGKTAERDVKPSVVIVGGSFAGLRAQRALSETCDVTVVDFKDYSEYTPGVLRLYTRPERLPSLVAPLPVRRSKLCLGETTSITPEAVHVRVADGAAAAAVPASCDVVARLNYDYAIVACGRAYPCAPVRPTPRERTVVERQASWDAAAKALQGATSVLVVGGGLVGVELAAEIVDAFPLKRVTLVSSGASLCSSLPAKVGLAAAAWLESKGVSLRMRSPVSSVHEESGTALLRSGEALSASLVYDCRGNGPSHAPALCPPGSDMSRSLDAAGSVVVDEHLRALDGAAAALGGRVYAAGDVMSLRSCADLKLGHTAELNADVAAENVLLRHEHGGARQGTYPFAATGAHVAPRVFCVSLGESAGVLSFNGVVVVGILPAIVKAVLEWTKVAACAERPVGTLFWRVGDAVANWISRNLVPPPPPARPPPTPPEDAAGGKAKVAPSPALEAGSGARPLVLFDGVCLLCSAFVHFVLDHNQDGSVTFASLQGEVGMEVLERANLPKDLSTVVLIDEAGVHTRSTAALRVLMRCGYPYALLHHVLIWLPRPLRDLGYKGVAAVRYRLFGQDDGSSCRRMTKAMRERFLDHAKAA